MNSSLLAFIFLLVIALAVAEIFRAHSSVKHHAHEHVVAIVDSVRRDVEQSEAVKFTKSKVDEIKATVEVIPSALGETAASIVDSVLQNEPMQLVTKADEMLRKLDEALRRAEVIRAHFDSAVERFTPGTIKFFASGSFLAVEVLSVAVLLAIVTGTQSAKHGLVFLAGAIALRAVSLDLAALISRLAFEFPFDSEPLSFSNLHLHIAARGLECVAVIAALAVGAMSLCCVDKSSLHLRYAVLPLALAALSMLAAHIGPNLIVDVV
jgi:hypothetical protein